MGDEISQNFPKSKFVRMISYIVKIKELILAVVAIVTALVGWFKPQDTKVTQASYEILASKMNEVAKATESNHDDIQSLRSYLDGYTKGESRKIANLSPIASSSSSMLTPLVLPKQTARVSLFNAIKNSANSTPRVKAAAEAAETAEASGISEARSAPEPSPASPPEISPRPASAAPPPFAQVVESVSAR